MKVPLVFAVIFCSFLVGQIFGSLDWSGWTRGKRRENDVKLFRQASGDHFYEPTMRKINGSSDFYFPNYYDVPQFVITYIKHTDGQDTAHNVTVLRGGVGFVKVALKIERRAVGPLRVWNSEDRAVSGTLEIYGIHKSCFKNYSNTSDLSYTRYNLG